ncbi:hypothetical protein SLE2022_112800 [Rubroshorea leprosula]
MKCIRLLSDDQNSQSNSPRKSRIEGEVETREEYGRTMSSLEEELRDIRKIHLEMTLNYAEVEGQHEEFIVKPKGTKTGRR